MLHCPAKDHWLTIQVQFDEDVTVFDSAYSQVPFDVKKQIVSIIKSQHDKINLKVEKIRQQTNNTDCGIYAIAFATEVCHGNNPADVIYATGIELRSHLL